MVIAICFYTSLIVTINIVANAETNLFPPGFDISSLSAADISDRVYGSKLVLVVEQSQCVTIWCCKACILIMYNRLTIGRVENIAIKCLMVYVGLTFVVMEILYLGVWCQPFHNYWAVPTPNVQCNTAIHHLITNAVFNLSSDTILLAIALPMFIRSRMPLKKKMALVAVFGLGFFVILCAILNKYYSFTQPFGSMWTYWYTRESSTSMLVTNLPFIYTLLRRVFHLDSLDGASRTGSETPRRWLRAGRKASTPAALGPEKERSDSNSSSSQRIRHDPDLHFLTSPAWLEECEDSPIEQLAPIAFGGPTARTGSTAKDMSFEEMMLSGPVESPQLPSR